MNAAVSTTEMGCHTCPNGIKSEEEPLSRVQVRWTQQERPVEVNAALIEFLQALPSSSAGKEAYV
jgi:hypothetical protein